MGSCKFPASSATARQAGGYQIGGAGRHPEGGAEGITSQQQIVSDQTHLAGFADGPVPPLICGHEVFSIGDVSVSARVGHLHGARLGRAGGSASQVGGGGELIDAGDLLQCPLLYPHR